MTGLQLAIAVDAEKQAEDEEWDVFVYEYEDVGVFTLMSIWPLYPMELSELWRDVFTYKSVEYFRQDLKRLVVHWSLRLGLLLSLISQIMIPITIFVLKMNGYEQGWCPSTAEPGKRLLMLGIAFIYFPRLLIPNAAKVHRNASRKAENEKKDKLNNDFSRSFFYPRSTERAIEPELGSYLDFCVNVDKVMGFVYEPLVYMLNLWLVFITEDELEMVLNALAMEFIMKVDEELKTELITFIKANELDRDRFKRANLVNRDPLLKLAGGEESWFKNPRWHPANYGKAPVTYFLKVVGHNMLLFSPLIVLAGGIAGSFCKV